MPDKTILVAGGAGFIGSNYIKLLLKQYKDVKIICLDKLTYAGNLKNLSEELGDERLSFVRGDICNRELVEHIFKKGINYVINFAAESHVDRSISDPTLFLKTNILGTENLLEISRKNWQISEEKFKKGVRFIQVSTDEVYGSLGENGFFTEKTPIAPNNPYSASKAGADHIIKSYINTYNFPAIITRCSNNYGPYQFPEKLIPLVINNIVNIKKIPVYGDGTNIRDWIYVKDHCAAIDVIRKKGKLGNIYNIGGSSEKSNIELVKTIINRMKKIISEGNYSIFKDNISKINYDLIKFVKDRKSHDRRYAMDFSKINQELGWKPKIDFESGIDKTIRWYLDNWDWMEDVTSKDYRKYYQKRYGEL